MVLLYEKGIPLSIKTAAANQHFRSRNMENADLYGKRYLDFIHSVTGGKRMGTENPIFYSLNHLRKRYQNMALQGKILLFYMEGEIQQLEHIFTQEHQKTALDTLCRELNETLQFAAKSLEEAAPDELKRNLQGIPAHSDRSRRSWCIWFIHTVSCERILTFDQAPFCKLAP